MPRVGVYSYDSDLHWTLIEYLDGVSNRHLLHEGILAPVYQMVEDFKQGTLHPYIIREKHRRWAEIVKEQFGIWLEVPEWECIHDQMIEGNGFHECDICHWLYEEEPEWVLYGDDVDISYNLLEKFTLDLFADDDVRVVIDALLNMVPDLAELYLWSRSYNAIYIIRSRAVEGCAPVEEKDWRTLAGLSPMGDCEVAGDIPTYVLPQDIVMAWVKEVAANE
jgi:hypothetical protein